MHELKNLEECIALAAEPLPPPETPPLRPGVTDYSQETRTLYGDLMDACDDLFVHIDNPSTIQTNIAELTDFLAFNPDEQAVQHTSKTIETLFDLGKLQVVIDKFTEYGRCGAALVTPTGAIIGEPSRLSTLCTNYVRSTELGGSRCAVSDQQFGSLSFDRATFGPCHTGALTDGGGVIQLNGVQLASFLIGGVATSMPNAENTKTMVRMAQDLGQDSVDVVKAFRRARRMNMGELQTLGESLHVVCKFLSQMAAKNFAARQKARLTLLSEERRHHSSKGILAALASTTAARLYHAFSDAQDRPRSKATNLLRTPTNVQILLLPLVAAWTLFSADSTVSPVKKAFLAIVAPASTRSLHDPIATAVCALVVLAMYGVALLSYQAAKRDLVGYRAVVRRGARLMSVAVSMAASFTILGVLGQSSIGLLFEIDQIGARSAVGVIWNYLVSCAAAAALVAALIFFVFTRAVVPCMPPTAQSVHLGPTIGLHAGIYLSFAATGASIGAVSFTDLASEESRSFVLSAQLTVAFIAAAISLVTTVMAVFMVPDRSFPHYFSIYTGVIAFSNVVIFIGAMCRFVAWGEFEVHHSVVIVTGVVLCVACFVTTMALRTVTLVRVAFFEHAVFRVIAGTGDHDEVRVPSLLWAALTGEKQRRAFIHQFATTPVYTIKHPDLANLSPLAIEVGSRCLMWPDRKLFGKVGFPPLGRYNLHTTASNLMRRAFTLYGPKRTAPLQLAIAYTAAMIPEAIDNTRQDLDALSQKFLDPHRFTHQMLLHGMGQCLEYRRYVVALDGDDQAEAFIAMHVLLDRARAYHFQALAQISKFWPMLLRKQPDLPLIVHNAKLIAMSTEQAGRLYNRLVSRYGDNPTVREWYILFLDSVMQDHSRAQQLRTEREEQNLAAASEGTGSMSSLDASSVGKESAILAADPETRGTATDWAIFLSFALNALLVGLSVLLVFGCVEYTRGKVDLVNSLHNINLAVADGALDTMLLSLSDEDLESLSQGRGDVVARVMSAYTAVASYDNFMLTMADADLLFFARTTPVELPQRHKYLVAHPWEISAMIAQAFASLASNPVSTVVSRTEALSIATRSQLEIRDNALDVFTTVVEALCGSARLAVVTMVLVDALCTVAVGVVQLSVICIMGYWIVLRGFSTEIRVCDAALSDCLAVSRAQVRRQMRLIDVAKSKFKDIDFDLGFAGEIMDNDDFEANALILQSPRGQQSDTPRRVAPQATFQIPEETSDVDLTEEGQDLAECLPRPAYDDVADIPETDSDLHFDVVPVGLMASSMTSSSTDDLQTIGDDSDSGWAMPSLGFKGIRHSGSNNSNTTSSTRTTPTPTAALQAFLAMIAQLSARGKPSLLPKGKRHKKRGPKLPTTASRAIDLLSMAAGVLLVLCLTGLIVMNLYGLQTFVFNDIVVEKDLQFSTMRFIKERGCLLYDATNFAVTGSLQSFAEFDSANVGDLAAEPPAEFQYLHDLLLTDDLVAFSDSVALLEHYMGVAVNLGALGAGYSDDLVFKHATAWNYTAENTHGYETEAMGRTVWYNNTAADSTLPAADQRVIAQAVIFDKAVRDAANEMYSALYSQAGLIYDKNMANADRMDTFGIALAVDLTTIVVSVLAGAFMALPLVVRILRHDGLVRKHAIAIAGTVLCIILVITAHAVVMGRVDRVVAPHTTLRATAQRGMTLERLDVVFAHLVYTVQRFVYMPGDGAFVDALEGFTDLQTHIAAMLSLEEDGYNLEENLALFISLRTELSVAFCLAADAYNFTLEEAPAIIQTFAWNSSDAASRGVDQLRYSNSTYDLALPTETKVAMAKELCLADWVTRADFRILSSTTWTNFLEYASGVAGQVGSYFTTATASSAAVIVLCLLALLFTAFYIIPMQLSSILQQKADVMEQQTVLNQSLRGYFIIVVAVLCSIATVLIGLLAVSVLAVFALSRLFSFLSTSTHCDSSTVNAATCAILASSDFTSGYHTELEAATDSLVTEIGAMFDTDVFSEYILYDTVNTSASAAIASMVSALKDFEAIAPAQEYEDLLNTRLITFLQTLEAAKPALESSFHARVDRVDLVMSLVEATAVVGGLCFVILLTISYFAVIRRLCRHLARYSTALLLLRSYLR
ncbi:Sensory domain found in PocR [Carpediemonas membranifera]|uniref:Sensory domain found in PocR n=1 Tax=Carpediemonas membranifera TaxID=201153 RepID=A0A8J6E5M0_9EUKA|nr:Sensory domain found in PocR [Carpediemonas membranifera]|eukprot:KAG9395962.1 Sensory domain found in PocR [Carpediemonas membranifera]